MCEKSDGIRCLLWFTNVNALETHYLIDRNNDYYHVSGLHFPRPAPAPTQHNPRPETDFASAHEQTLLDGELLVDTYPDGHQRLKYLVFDCLAVDNNLLIQRTLDKRLGYFKDFILKPYHALWAKFPEDASKFVLTVEEKRFQFADGISLMFDEIIPKLKHGSDGLIFTCRETSYKFGTDDNILKWKPAEENSIDFKLELTFPANDIGAMQEDEVHEFDFDVIPKFTLNVRYDHDYEPDYEMFAEPHEWEKMKEWALEHETGLDGVIVECHKDSENRWRLNRFRDDKKEPNFHTVVQKVLKSIKDAVNKNELAAASPTIRDGRKQRQAKGEREALIRRQEDERRQHAHEQRQREMKQKHDEQKRQEQVQSEDRVHSKTPTSAEREDTSSNHDEAEQESPKGTSTRVTSEYSE